MDYLQDFVVQCSFFGVFYGAMSVRGGWRALVTKNPHCTHQYGSIQLKVDIGYHLVLWNLWLALGVNASYYSLIPVLVGFALPNREVWSIQLT